MVNDRLKGRPMRLNRRVLEPKPNKGYAEVVYLGDVHYGCVVEHKKHLLVTGSYLRYGGYAARQLPAHSAPPFLLQGA